MDYLERVKQAIEYIESHLKEDITLERAASEACFSPYHFHRIFHALVHENFKEYIRKRRLSNAACELINTDKEILQISFDYRFESQESFTRSFKKMFGTAPGRFRENRILPHAFYKQEMTGSKLYHFNNGVTMNPKIVNTEEIKIIGLSIKTNLKDNKVPQLWQDYMKRDREVKNFVMPEIYLGVCINESDKSYKEFTAETAFTEIVGKAVKNFDHIPQGMTTKVVPAYKYAVFTHKGALNTLGDTYDYIYGTWLPKSGMSFGDADDFELYDGRFKMGAPDSEMDIYIPVKD
jgi:AraC family transcriptional regulator